MTSVIDPNGEFEILFRFYGPLPPLFEKTWVLPDIELVADWIIPPTGLYRDCQGPSLFLRRNSTEEIQ